MRVTTRGYATARRTLANERSTPLVCLVIVNRSSDVIDMADPASAPARSTPGAARREEAFVALADRHLDRAYRLARAILRDPTDAQDATHDALVQAWQRWEMLRDPARFEAWFDRILVNTCRNRLRGRRQLATDISAEIALASGDHVSRTEDREVVGAAIARLSPDHQVVVALRFYRDLTVDDIALRLGIPGGTVRSRLHYALRQLHDAIGAADTTGTER
jgi:RNA polymerase sigma-70 factor (ECF subfamily)